MRYKPLGRTGLFGLRTLPRHHDLRRQRRHLAARSARCSRPTPTASSARALDAGINFIDTADVYSDGAVRADHRPGARRTPAAAARQSCVATKVFGETGTGPNARGASRGHIMDGVKASLKRLQLDHIDLYQIHGFDPADADRGDRARARRSRAPGPCPLCRRLQLGRPGRSSRRWASPSSKGWRASRRCRPTTPSPAATSSARSCRCCRAESSA